jgi:acyl-CoA synthetase (AMP-forming)/AMP-acid ligase II
MYGGVDVLEAYAMTEACHQMTSNPIGGGRKPGSVGVAQGTVQIAIFDPSSDIPINEANKRGEVCVKGPNVMKKYLDNDFANKSAFTSSGFFRTGDEGHMDEGGFLTITGRLKEMINKGGEKISPIEIDSALLAHPAVMEAVAFAIPDPKYGEVVGAAVRLRADMMHVSEADLMMFVGTKLASFKVPGGVFIVSELPRTASGKIQRRLIAAQFISKSKL